MSLCVCVSVCLSVLRGSLDHRGLVSDPGVGFPVGEEQHGLHERSIGTGDPGKKGGGGCRELRDNVLSRGVSSFQGLIYTKKCVWDFTKCL